MSQKIGTVKKIRYDEIDGVKVPRPQKVDKEAPVRSIAKAITWRIIGTIDTTMLGWLISGSFATGLKIGGLEVLTKMFLYYLHERAWTNIKWGKSWMRYGLIRRIKLALIKRKRRKVSI